MLDACAVLLTDAFYTCRYGFAPPVKQPPHPVVLLLLGFGGGFFVSGLLLSLLGGFLGQLRGMVLHIFLDHTMVGEQYVRYDLTRRRHIVAVADRDGPVYTAVGLAVPVVDAAGRQAAVGYDYRLVVVGGDDGMEYLYLLDGAGITLRLYVVAYLVGFQQQYQHSAGKILQRAAQGHTDGHAHRGENGQERAGLQSQNTYHGNQQDEIQHYVDQRQNEGSQAAVHLAVHHDGPDDLVDFPDDETPHIEHDYRHGEVYGKLGGSVNQFIHDLVQRERFQHLQLLFGVRYLRDGVFWQGIDKLQGQHICQLI